MHPSTPYVRELVKDLADGTRTVESAVETIRQRAQQDKIELSKSFSFSSVIHALNHLNKENPDGKLSFQRNKTTGLFAQNAAPKRNAGRDGGIAAKALRARTRARSGGVEEGVGMQRTVLGSSRSPSPLSAQHSRALAAKTDAKYGKAHAHLTAPLSKEDALKELVALFDRKPGIDGVTENTCRQKTSGHLCGLFLKEGEDKHCAFHDKESRFSVLGYARDEIRRDTPLESDIRADLKAFQPA